MIDIDYKDKGNIEVHCTYSGDNPCLHIENSNIITNKADILNTLKYIHGTDDYKKLLESGYNRTLRSQYYEWVGHNVLYRIGFMRDRTGSVDIDNKEPKWRMIIYAFLSIF